MRVALPRMGSMPVWAAGALFTALLAVGLLLYGAVKAIAKTPALPVVGNSEPVTFAPPEQEPVLDLDYFNVIQQRNLFKAAIEDATSIGDLPMVQLNVKLLGTIHNDNEPLSRAIVLQGDKQSLVKKGDPLEGYTIVGIQRRALILAKGGKRTVLLLDSENARAQPTMPGGMNGPLF